MSVLKGKVHQLLLTVSAVLIVALLVNMHCMAVTEEETLCFTQRVTDASSFNIYTGRNDANNPIDWTHTVPTGILDSVVRVGIYIEAYDVDYSDGEHDRVSFNGYDLGLLEGYNDSWLTVEKTVPVEALREGINNIKVNVDEGNEGWKVTIRASELRFYCSSADEDFSIGISPETLTIDQGSQDTTTVELIGLNGFDDSVTLSAEGLPTGVTAGFSSNPIAPNPAAGTTLTLTASNIATPGTHQVTIRGISGSLDHTTTLQLVINQVYTPDFEISSTPVALTMARGEQNSTRIDVTGKDGFSDPVTLSIDSLPPGLSADFSENPVTPESSASSQLTFTTSHSVATGTYDITVIGTSGSTIHQTTVSVTVVLTNYDVSIEAEPGKGRPPLEVVFGAVVNPEPPEGTIFDWDFGDRSSGEDQEVNHTYTEAGVFTANLVMTLPSGETFSAAPVVIETIGYDGQVVLNFNPSRVNPGEETILKIWVNNPQQFEISDLRLDFSLNNKLELQKQAFDYSTQVNGQQIIVDLPTIAANDGVSMTFKMKVKEDASAQTIGQTAVLSHPGFEEKVVSDPAQLVILGKELKLRKEVNITEGESGDSLRYRLVVSNPHQVTLKNVKLADTLPRQVDFISASGPLVLRRDNNKLTFIGNLPAAPSYEWFIEARIREDVFSGDRIINQASLQATGLKGKINSNTVQTSIKGTTVEEGQVSITHKSEIPQADVGRIVRLRVTVRNQSSSNLIDPRIRVQLPTGFDYVANSSLWNNRQISDPDGKRFLVWRVPAIKANSTLSLRYQAIIGSSSSRGKNLVKASLLARDARKNEVREEADAFVNVSALGLVFLSGIEGVVYVDKDNDGMYTPFDQVLPGVEVVISSGDRLQTDQNGKFEASGMYAGEYAIAINRSTLDRKYIVPFPQVQTVMLADGFSDFVELPVLLAQEDQERPCSISGTVFFDKNRDGKYSDDDSLVKKFEVHLNDSAVMQCSNGKFKFKHLEPGDYTILVNYGNKSVSKEISITQGEYELEIPLEFSGITVIVEGEGQ